MNFSELVFYRQSVRRYSAKAVEPEKITAIMEACRMAPSACNSQPWHFVIVNDPELKDQLARATFSSIVKFNQFVLQAPVIAALVGEPASLVSKAGSIIRNKQLHMMDIGIVAEHFCLQAAELDLGTCMLGWFNEKKVKQLLEIPAGKRVPLLITLGYPFDDKKRQKIRKPPEKLFSFNRYSG